MLRVDRILGDARDPEFAGRRHDAVLIDWADAVRRRLRRESVEGEDVAIAVPRGSFLAHGAVLHDDGQRIVVVARAASPVLIIRFESGLDASDLVKAAASIGHAFGNQHAPIEVCGDEIIVPVTTSITVATETVERLGLTGVSCESGHVPVARYLAIRGEVGHRSHGSDDLHHDHAIRHDHI